MIAGTGRAGTSFLVRFLGACGLDTGEPELFFDARARAGLESNLLDERAPYVVKDPWLFAYCDQIDPDEVEVEALLVPIRDLTAAATSRILQERIAMADSYWSDLPPSDVHGLVAGGAVYSLDPVDEARILAVGFHRLILWATARQIPLFLLEFPRIVTDAEYLVDTLWPWLGSRCDRERAMCAFASVADRDLVRVDGTQVSSPAERASEAENLDRAAMSYLLKEREANLRAARDKVAEFEHRLPRDGPPPRRRRTSPGRHAGSSRRQRTRSGAGGASPHATAGRGRGRTGREVHIARPDDGRSANGDRPAGRRPAHVELAGDQAVAGSSWRPAQGPRRPS